MASTEDEKNKLTGVFTHQCPMSNTNPQPDTAASDKSTGVSFIFVLSHDNRFTYTMTLPR